jgi:CRP-like cAMP-binding protein
MITELSRRLRKADQDIESLAFLDVESRLKKYFIKQVKIRADSLDDKIRLNRKLTHKQLAHQIGTSRETITRIMRRLEKKGLIEVTEKTIFLKDIEEWD